jgi:hypothetical protein
VVVYPSIVTKSREPPKIARRMAITNRKPALLLSEFRARVRKLLCDDSCPGKRCWRLVLSSASVEGLSWRRASPAMPKMAMRMGKIAVMRLKASPAAKLMTQSLLNLVQNSCKDLAPF